MCGWVSCEIARASRSKRSRNCGSPASCRGQDLDRDGAIEPRVARLVDLAHAARAERCDTRSGPRRVPGAITGGGSGTRRIDWGTRRLAGSCLDLDADANDQPCCLRSQTFLLLSSARGREIERGL